MTSDERVVLIGIEADETEAETEAISTDPEAIEAILRSTFQGAGVVVATRGGRRSLAVPVGMMIAGPAPELEIADVIEIVEEETEIVIGTGIRDLLMAEVEIDLVAMIAEVEVRSGDAVIILATSEAVNTKSRIVTMIKRKKEEEEEVEIEVRVATKAIEDPIESLIDLGADLAVDQGVRREIGRGAQNTRQDDRNARNLVPGPGQVPLRNQIGRSKRRRPLPQRRLTVILWMKLRMILL